MLLNVNSLIFIRQRPISTTYLKDTLKQQRICPFVIITRNYMHTVILKDVHNITKKYFQKEAEYSFQNNKKNSKV